jgi:hypothetical protein
LALLCDPRRSGSARTTAPQQSGQTSINPDCDTRPRANQHQPHCNLSQMTAPNSPPGRSRSRIARTSESGIKTTLLDGDHSCDATRPRDRVAAIVIVAVIVPY